MSRQATLHRFALILEQLETNQWPSFEQIKRKISQTGIAVSKRTLQRDINQIRFEFGVDIVYDRLKRGYGINFGASPGYEGLQRLLEYSTLSRLLDPRDPGHGQVLRYIDLEDQATLQGYSNLAPILQAISQCRPIRFTHFSYSKQTWTPYKIKPYRLRQYQNRWYVIGTVVPEDQIRTFGVDRIHDLTIDREKFERDKGLGLDMLFKEVIGLTYNVGKAEDLRLLATPQQSLYLKSLPLHHSQKLVQEDEAGSVFAYQVRINYELKQRLLMLGDQIKVLAPSWFVQEYVNMCNRVSKLYSMD